MDLGSDNNITNDVDGDVDAKPNMDALYNDPDASDDESN